MTPLDSTAIDALLIVFILFLLLLLLLLLFLISIFIVMASLKFIRLPRVIFSSQQRLNRPAVNVVQ